MLGRRIAKALTLEGNGDVFEFPGEGLVLQQGGRLHFCDPGISVTGKLTVASLYCRPTDSKTANVSGIRNGVSNVRTYTTIFLDTGLPNGTVTLGGVGFPYTTGLGSLDNDNNGKLSASVSDTVIAISNLVVNGSTVVVSNGNRIMQVEYE